MPPGAETHTTQLHPWPPVHSGALSARLVWFWFPLTVQTEFYSHQKTEAFTACAFFLSPSAGQLHRSVWPLAAPASIVTAVDEQGGWVWVLLLEWHLWVAKTRWIGQGLLFLILPRSGAASAIALTSFPAHPTALLFSVGKVSRLGRD